MKENSNNNKLSVLDIGLADNLLAATRQGVDQGSDIRGGLKGSLYSALDLHRNLLADPNLPTSITASMMPGVPEVIIGAGLLFSIISFTINLIYAQKQAKQRKIKIDRIIELETENADKAPVKEQYLAQLVWEFLVKSQGRTNKHRRLEFLIAEALDLDVYHPEFIAIAKKRLNALDAKYNISKKKNEQYQIGTLFFNSDDKIEEPAPKKETRWTRFKSWVESKSTPIKVAFVFIASMASGTSLVLGISAFFILAPGAPFTWPIFLVAGASALIHAAIYSIYAYRQDKVVAARGKDIDTRLKEAVTRNHLIEFKESLTNQKFDKTTVRLVDRKDVEEKEKVSAIRKHLNRYTIVSTILGAASIGVAVVSIASWAIPALPYVVPLMVVVGLAFAINAGMRKVYALKADEVSEKESVSLVNRKEHYVRQKAGDNLVDAFLGNNKDDAKLNVAKAKSVAKVVEDFIAFSKRKPSLELLNSRKNEMLQVLVSVTKIKNQEKPQYNDDFFNCLLGYLNHNNPKNSAKHNQIVCELKKKILPNNQGFFEKKNYKDAKKAERAHAILNNIIGGMNSVSNPAWLILSVLGAILAATTIVIAPVSVALYATLIVLGVSAFLVKLYVDHKNKSIHETRENRSDILDLAKLDGKLNKDRAVLVVPQPVAVPVNPPLIPVKHSAPVRVKDPENLPPLAANKPGFFAGQSRDKASRPLMEFPNGVPLNI